MPQTFRLHETQKEANRYTKDRDEVTEIDRIRPFLPVERKTNYLLIGRGTRAGETTFLPLTFFF